MAWTATDISLPSVLFFSEDFIANSLYTEPDDVLQEKVLQLFSGKFSLIEPLDVWKELVLINGISVENKIPPLVVNSSALSHFPENLNLPLAVEPDRSLNVHDSQFIRPDEVFAPADSALHEIKSMFPLEATALSLLISIPSTFIDPLSVVSTIAAVLFLPVFR